MDRIHVAHFSRAHDAVDLQIISELGGAPMQIASSASWTERIDIRPGVDREGANAQLLAGAGCGVRRPVAIKTF